MSAPTADGMPEVWSGEGPMPLACTDRRIAETRYRSPNEPVADNCTGVACRKHGADVGKSCYVVAVPS